jgi:hypothetical protein
MQNADNQGMPVTAWNPVGRSLGKSSLLVTGYQVHKQPLQDSLEDTVIVLLEWAIQRMTGHPPP